VTLDKRFIAGLAYFLGARAIGAGVVRVGPGIPELQWDTIRRVRPTVLIGVPSFILRLIEYAEKKGIDYRNATIRKAICIGEPIRKSDFSLNTLGKRIKEKWDIEIYSTYASTEMSTAFTECPAGQGGHLHPDLLIVEFLDENNQPVDEGKPGEVTVTTLGVEGMPLLRFKTGDICHRSTEPCSCGRQTLRLGPVIGRKDQMIKYKGTTLYPPAFYEVLDSIEEVENYVVEASTNSIGMDEIYVKIGSKHRTEGLEKIIKDHFRARLRVAPRLGFFHPDKIHDLQFNKGSRKAIKFIDNRSKA
jgi:phenylacetate-CoA ligase